MTELKDIPMGTILEDWGQDGVRCLIIRGSTALCAYLGVPTEHPLAGFNEDAIPLEVHAGFNFARAGGTESPEDRDAGFHRPEGWFWYGWSYDRWCDLKIGQDPEEDPGAKPWPLEAVKEETLQAAYNFRKLVGLVEELTIRALGWRRAISAEKGDGTA